MSPNVGNFVHDLVEMAKAMETLPQVEHERDQLKAMTTEQGTVIASREEAIQRYKAEIEQLHAKVRTTEAERDDAELRFLELDEKAHKVLAHVASIQAAAMVVQESLTPPKSQPEPEAKPVPEVVHSIEPQPQGQGEGNPIPAAEASQTGDVVQAGTATTQSDASQSKPSGLYTNTLYQDYPGYVSRADWLAGGGTDDSYDWRPSAPNVADRSY